MSLLVTCEQGHSLAARLQEARIAHGDTAHGVVLQGVGFEQRKGELHLAFCPTTITKIGTIVEAPPLVRAAAMPWTVEISRPGRLKLWDHLRGHRGFATIYCEQIVSNGAIHLGGVQVLDYSLGGPYVRVNYRNAYIDYLAGCNA